MQKNIQALLLSALFMVASLTIRAQQSYRVRPNKCATMTLLEDRFRKNPRLRDLMEAQKAILRKAITARTLTGAANRSDLVINIPVVFHIVTSDPVNDVTDAQIQAQLDTLNIDYAGTNGDAVRVPDYFKPFFGKSQIQFVLAKRAPDNTPTTGIERITTDIQGFGTNGDVKFASSGGADIWNPDKYLNIWLAPLLNNILGFGTFPNDGVPLEQGVVIEYRSIPGGEFIGFNGGKTLTHEVGHYFNLIHIWGDDNGACTGTDEIDDTPNQGDLTTGCPTGVKTDNCSPAAPGVMYQNYMDYSDDACLVMFTNQQVSRMETALNSFRPSLLTSDGAVPVVLKANDAQILSITSPQLRVCAPGVVPVVVLRNLGTQPLTSVTITAQIDNGSVSSYSWTGSLASLTSTSVTLPALTTASGNHVLHVATTKPNNVTDENPENDTLSIAFFYQPPITTDILEGFEGTPFPPAGWDIVNQDKSITWERTTAAAKTGFASAVIRNFDYDRIGQRDLLRLPEENVTGLDSAFISFQVAAAAYSALTTANNVWDTLEVLVSSDCGANYTSVYKRWASSLVTRKAATTTFFVPAASEWRKDSVDLTPYISRGNLLLAFRNTTGFENNVYLDDINFRRVSINPNLKAQGFLVTPSPTTSSVAVQFYPQPTNLNAIQIYNMAGQKIVETQVRGGQGSNYNVYDLSRYAPGIYIVRAVFSNKVLYKKIVKQ